MKAGKNPHTQKKRTMDLLRAYGKEFLVFDPDEAGERIPNR